VPVLGDSPLVTVVVLAYNRARELRVTLTALREELDYPAELLEIIVVDNASSDGTAEMVREEFPAAELVVNEANVGIAGWNAGLQRGRGAYFLVLDDDCYVTGDALRRAVVLAGEHEADLVSFSAASPLALGQRFNDEYDTGLLAFWGCAALLSRRAVDELGGFDPEIFVWAHEAEFTMRLLDRGLRHLAMPEIVAAHMTVPASRVTPFFHSTNTRNLAYIAAKLLRPRDAAGALVNVATMALLRALIDPRTIGSLPAVVAGARAGLRNRAAVRPPVSRLYRRNLVDFVSPLRFVRGPDVAGVVARRRRFWRARPDLYPMRTSWLEL
jgi:GT2 family glycosyltransferase